VRDTDRDPDRDDQDTGTGGEPRRRPAWVDEADEAARPRQPRRQRRPVPGRHDEDELWEHTLVIGGLVTLGTWLSAIFIPAAVPLWQVTALATAVSVVTWYVSLTLTGSFAMSSYLGAWGTGLTGWMAAARLTSPWRGLVIFALLLLAAVLIPTGVTVIRSHRDRVKRVTETGRDTSNMRECRYWEGLLARLGVQGVSIRDVIRVEGGYQVHGRLGKVTEARTRPATMSHVLELAGVIAQHKRLPKGAVYIEDEPSGGTAADFIVHVRSVTGPRLARYLPAENRLLSINRAFSLGVMDTGREFMLKLREVVVFICGVRGSGKSTLLNLFIAQLSRMDDVVIFMIDLKGGQEARAWLMPWLRGQTGAPAIDWLATTREEAKVMLDALWRAGTARAESGRYGRKLRPGVYKIGGGDEMCPAIIVICDEQAVMTGHFIREDGISNTQLATRLLQIAETFRSVAIDPVVAAVRAVVDVTGNSGLKAMSEVRIGMKVSTAEEGRQIFPDNYAAAKQLAQLKDRGMGIPKVGAELYAPVHFYNITDGEPDDDDNPTEDRITPIVLATAGRRAKPEKLIRDAMGDDYAQRWNQPHIKQLCEQWRQEAGIAAPPPLPERPEDAAGPDGSASDDLAEEFRGILAASGIEEDDDDELGTRLHPARKRMRQLLIDRGRIGWGAGALWHQLRAEGYDVARETVSRWLGKDEKLGYVYRTGKPRSRWVWRLREGDEFDIPGMSG
jgi:hypothetical protein